MAFAFWWVTAIGATLVVRSITVPGSTRSANGACGFVRDVFADFAKIVTTVLSRER